MHSSVCFESATAVFDPSFRPDRRCCQDRTGMMARLSAAITIPAAECCASPPPVSERTASMGDERGEGEEGHGDDPQGQVFTPFRILRSVP